MSLASDKVIILLDHLVAGLSIPGPQGMMVAQATRLLSGKLADVPEAEIVQWCENTAVQLMAVTNSTIDRETMHDALEVA